MNLLGRYLEEGRFCRSDAAAAYDWYRRSAEAGDFRGQFSHAALLTRDGKIDEALQWLHRAFAVGSLNFLRVGSRALLQAPDPRIQELGHLYRQRAEQMYHGGSPDPHVKA